MDIDIRDIHRLFRLILALHRLNDNKKILQQECTGCWHSITTSKTCSRVARFPAVIPSVLQSTAPPSEIESHRGALRPSAQTPKSILLFCHRRVLSSDSECAGAWVDDRPYVSLMHPISSTRNCMCWLVAVAMSRKNRC